VSADDRDLGEELLEPSSQPAWVPRWVGVNVERSRAWFDELRTQITAVDIGMDIYERDKLAAGTLLGSALSLRLFLFFVPLVLFAVGVAGVAGEYLDVGSVAGDAGISGSLATEIDRAFDQGATTPWLALLGGLVGIGTAGRSLTRALVLSSAMSWRLGGKQKIPARIVGIVVGIVIGVALVSAILNRIRLASGIAVASVSMVAVAALYGLLWSVLYLSLPRGTSDPGAALPGATIVAVMLACLQAVSQLYLPERLDEASSIYGTIGIAVVTLGWFFIMGRVMAFSFAVNAVIFERLGSVSGFVFGLPLLRMVPARWPAFARFFDLEHPDDGRRPDGTGRDL
jgi:uncharacterized BrkB/YihY/UPF0761 family membrane protein